MSFATYLIGSLLGVRLGRGANATAAGSIAIGSTTGDATAGVVTDGAHATGVGAIAIGAGAKATAAGAVQIGPGTNATASVTKFGQPLSAPLMQTPTLTGGAATAAAVLRVGETVTEGMELHVLDKEITLTNAVSAAVVTLPANVLVVGAQLNVNVAVTGDGSGDTLFTKIGLGHAGDVDLLGLTPTLTKNSKGGYVIVPALLGSTAILLYTCKDNGSASTDKFVAGGKVRVRLYYVALNDLDDAA